MLRVQGAATLGAVGPAARGRKGTTLVGTQVAIAAEVLGILLCPLVVWFTIGRSMMRAGRWAAHLPVGPLPEMPQTRLAQLDGLRITSVLAWEADLLVGFERAHGSWVHPDAAPSETPRVIRGLRNFSGALRLPGLGGDERSVRLVEEWWKDGRALLAVLAEDGLTLLADAASRTVVRCWPAA
jgi:hypothetical protein